MCNSTQRGTTLIELVIAIVIAGIMLGGIVGTFNRTVERSADPMIGQQSMLVAKALMEEILLKPFLDPALQTVCPTPPVAGRTAYDNVCDYHGYTSTNAVSDQQGNNLAGLAGYSVSISVIPALDSDELGDIPSTRALKIEVTVNNALSRPLTLTAWRACYESTVCASL